MPSRRKMKLIVKLVQEAFNEAAEEFLVSKAMSIYKSLMTKNLFLTMENYEEFDRKGPYIARLVKEVIMGVTKDVCGSPCTEKKSEDIASKAWQKLREEYQAE